MVDTTRAKNKLQSTIGTLEETSKSYVQNIERIVQRTAFELNNELVNRELYIDEDVRDKLGSVRERTNNLVARLNTEKGGVPAADPKRPIYDDLTSGAGPRHNNIVDRSNEYNELADLAGRFELGNNLNDITCAINSPRVQLDLNNMTVGAAPTPNYTLCDEDGKALRTGIMGGNTYYEMVIGCRTVRVFGISIVGRNVNFDHITLNPADVDLSNPIKLSVNASYIPVTPSIHTIRVISNKPFTFNLKESIALGDIARGGQMTAYNNAGGLNVVTAHLENTFVENEARLLRDAIATAVARTNSPIFDTLSDSQKEDFYRRMLDTARTTIPGLPIAPGRAGRTGLAAVLSNANNFNDFSTWFCHDDRAWNKDPKNTKNGTTYTQYIHDHFRDEAKNYYAHRLDAALNNPTSETFLKAQVNNYLVEIDNNKRDDPNLRNRVENDLDSDEVKMEKKPFYNFFKDKDNNFMRFFSGSNKEIKDQKVNISTTTPGNPVDRGPINYDMILHVAENNKLGVDLTIGGTKLDLIQSGDWDPTTLAQRILREPSITEHKVRVHVVYNLYKGLLELAKEKNMKLEYFHAGPPAELREINLDSSGNIVLNAVQYGTTPPYTRTSTTLFDQQGFQNTNQFNDIAMHNSLEEGVAFLSRHFAYAMNQLHDQYRRSTKRSIWKRMGITSNTALPTSFWTSPIRKIINGKNTMNFDFTTSVGETQISLKGNKFTITDPKLDKPLETKDLGKVLTKRVNKVRIFDGKERDIVEAIYSNLVKKMRENSKVRRSNFGVIDDVTGHMYILDENGHFGRINRDALNGRNILHNRFLFFKTKTGVINSKLLRGGARHGPGYVYHRLTPEEERSVLKNPLLMQGFVKAMNRRMGLYESARARFERH